MQGRQRGAACVRIEAVAGALHAENGDETARVVEDGDGDCGQVFLALFVGLAPAALVHLGDSSGELCGVGDRPRGERSQLGWNFCLCATTEGKHDFADRRGVGHAGAPHEGRRAHATATGDVIDGDTLAGCRERERGRFARCGLHLVEDGASHGADVEALQHVGTELQQAHAQAVTACGFDLLDEAVAGERAEQARGRGGGDVKSASDVVHAQRLRRVGQNLEHKERALDGGDGSAGCCHVGNGTRSRMLSAMEAVETRSALAALREHFPARWQLALRFGVVVGAPFAAGTSAGAHPLGAIAAASALLILLMGPPGYGIARRSQVIGIAVLIGLAAAIGALIQNHEVVLVLLLLLVGGFFAFARKVDRSMATIALVPVVGLLIGSGSSDGLRSAIELLIASLIGGALYLLLLDRVWPSPEHPSVALEGRAKRLLPALILVLPVGYVLASLVVDWHMAAYAFALLGILLILNARGAHRTTRHELLGFVVILAITFGEIQIDARVDVMVFTAVIVAIVGAWRAERGTVPLWSILGTLLVLIASVS